jgi:hypothetical protein
MNLRSLLTVLLGLLAPLPLASAAEPVGFARSEDRLEIRIGTRPFATYVFRDPKILRPYLAHVRAPDGAQVTRNLPPVAGTDRTDHDTMHPGIWLAFGDLDGADFWRNKGAVEHTEFVENPTAAEGVGRFAVKNRYRDHDRVVCQEVCRIRIEALEGRTLVVWDSTFSGDQQFAFGDQEEMGLGVRVATPLAVVNGGTLSNADGHKNEKQLWGKPSDWCDYSGLIAGQPAGIMLVPDPKNFRRSWFHARDYGFVAANPFGHKAFTGGEASQVVVRPGESLRLRYAVVVHSGPVDLPAVATSALQALESVR